MRILHFLSDCVSWWLANCLAASDMVLQCFTWIAHLMNESIGLFSHSFKKGVVRDLPDDVVVDILSRLPAECVLICRSVCTRWRSLTSTEHFIQFHLSRAAPAIFVQSIHYPDFIKRELGFFVYDAIFTKRKKMRKLPECKITEDFTELVIGSCDGLLLFSDVDSKRHCHVINPVTQEHTSIVFPSRGFVCGFFRHPLSNECKFLFYGFYNGCKEYFVYTLGGSFWRKIKHPPFPCEPTNGKTAPPAICNRALHWISRRYLFDWTGFTPCECAILVFDVLTEDFHTLPHPGNGCKNIVCHETMSLLAANEQLSFYYLDEKEKFIDIWILEEYSTWGWIRKWKLNINLAERPRELLFYYPDRSSTIWHVELLYIHDRQLWLDCNTKGLFFYQLDQNTVTRVDAPPFRKKGFTSHRCIAFTRSLLLLDKLSFGGNTGEFSFCRNMGV